MHHPNLAVSGVKMLKLKKKRERALQLSECLLLENIATCDMINDSFIAKPGVVAKPGFQFPEKDDRKPESS